MQTFMGGVAFGEVLLYGPVRSAQVGKAATGAHVRRAPSNLVGWSLRETSGANPATVRLQDGGRKEGPL